MIYEYWPGVAIDNTYRPAWEQSSWSCNCACSICMAGQCCMDPNRYQQPTIVTTGTGYVEAPHTHAWQAISTERRRRRSYVIQSCPCGDVRRVLVP